MHVFLFDGGKVILGLLRIEAIAQKLLQLLVQEFVFLLVEILVYLQLFAPAAQVSNGVLESFNEFPVHFLSVQVGLQKGIDQVHLLFLEVLQEGVQFVFLLSSESLVEPLRHLLEVALLHFIFALVVEQLVGILLDEELQPKELFFERLEPFLGIAVGEVVGGVVVEGGVVLVFKLTLIHYN